MHPCSLWAFEAELKNKALKLSLNNAAMFVNALCFQSPTHLKILVMANLEVFLPQQSLSKHTNCSFRKINWNALCTQREIC